MPAYVPILRGAGRFLFASVLPRAQILALPSASLDALVFSFSFGQEIVHGYEMIISVVANPWHQSTKAQDVGQLDTLH